MEAREQGFVDVEINSNGLGTVTFGHPMSNSLPGKVLRKLAQTITDLGNNMDVRVILLKSEGERAFCAGASFDELIAIEDLQTGHEFFSGFAGVIKRHNFSSNRASHGNSVSHNKPGSIGMAQDPGRVFPGKRMPGHMGAVTRTQQSLQIVRIDVERNLLLIRGAVPGSRGGDVMVRPAVRTRRPPAVKQGGKAAPAKK
jgi:hypothetical protein